MSKWDIVGFICELATGIFGAVGFVAAMKTNEDLDDRVRRIMLEDKNKSYEQKNDAR